MSAGLRTNAQAQVLDAQFAAQSEGLADVVADLGSKAGREAAVAGILERAPEGLDGFVACAGVGPYLPPPLIASINYFGVVELTQGLRAALEPWDQPHELVRGLRQVIAKKWNHLMGALQRIDRSGHPDLRTDGVKLELE